MTLASSSVAGCPSRAAARQLGSAVCVQPGSLRFIIELKNVYVVSRVLYVYPSQRFKIIVVEQVHNFFCNRTRTGY